MSKTQRDAIYAARDMLKNSGCGELKGSATTESFAARTPSRQGMIRTRRRIASTEGWHGHTRPKDALVCRYVIFTCDEVFVGWIVDCCSFAFRPRASRAFSQRGE